MLEVNNYTTYRGKCREFCEELIQENPTYTIHRGHYYCPIWGKQEHWWCKNSEGTIIDPTVKQFPSWTYADSSFYEEFDGICTCEECGKAVLEEEAIFMGRYATCSRICASRLVGL